MRSHCAICSISGVTALTGVLRNGSATFIVSSRIFDLESKMGVPTKRVLEQHLLSLDKKKTVVAKIATSTLSLIWLFTIQCTLGKLITSVPMYHVTSGCRFFTQQLDYGLISGTPLFNLSFSVYDCEAFCNKSTEKSLNILGAMRHDG